jgi:DNA-binding SARP family transcriptional activator
MLHVRVCELRAALRAARPQLLTTGGGYVLRVGSDQLDAERFERLTAAGAAALSAGDPVRARTELAAGLALWRGPALVEFAEERFARPDAARLDELRLQAVENRIAADLALGRHGAVVADLEKLTANHPLRERFWAQLMLALYRAGRRGDALRVYQTARQQITEQLGLDPGQALQLLHRAILTADPLLDVFGPAPKVEFDDSIPR